MVSSWLSTTLPGTARFLTEKVLGREQLITPALIKSVSEETGATHQEIVTALRSFFMTRGKHIHTLDHFIKATTLPSNKAELIKRMGINQGMKPVKLVEAFHHFALEQCGIELGIYPYRFKNFLKTQAFEGNHEILRVFDSLLTGKPLPESDKKTAETIIHFINENTCFGRMSSEIISSIETSKKQTKPFSPNLKGYISDLEQNQTGYYISQRMQSIRKGAMAKIQVALTSEEDLKTGHWLDGKFIDELQKLLKN